MKIELITLQADELDHDSYEAAVALFDCDPAFATYNVVKVPTAPDACIYHVADYDNHGSRAIANMDHPFLTPAKALRDFVFQLIPKLIASPHFDRYVVKCVVVPTDPSTAGCLAKCGCVAFVPPSKALAPASYPYGSDPESELLQRAIDVGAEKMTDKILKRFAGKPELLSELFGWRRTHPKCISFGGSQLQRIESEEPEEFEPTPAPAETEEWRIDELLSKDKSFWWRITTGEDSFYLTGASRSFAERIVRLLNADSVETR